jgi:hypothetical protein
VEHFDAFVAGMLSMDRWPFWSAVLVFTIVGQFTSVRLFTRERAYRQRKQLWHHWFWYWARETLTIHSVAAGLVLGLFWRDPEGHGWNAIGSQMYFAAAGVISLFFWTLLKALAKRQGIELTLPGDSSRPPPPPASEP